MAATVGAAAGAVEAGSGVPQATRLRRRAAVARSAPPVARGERMGGFLAGDVRVAWSLPRPGHTLTGVGRDQPVKVTGFWIGVGTTAGGTTGGTTTVGVANVQVSSNHGHALQHRGGL